MLPKASLAETGTTEKHMCLVLNNELVGQFLLAQWYIIIYEDYMVLLLSNYSLEN